jgi:hypothetical protein
MPFFHPVFSNLVLMTSIFEIVMGLIARDDIYYNSLRNKVLLFIRDLNRQEKAKII